jgi:hypothetical protein
MLLAIMDINWKQVLWVLVGAVLLFGCTSRYRLDLYMTSEGAKKKVKVEKAELLAGSALNDPYARQKTIDGVATTAIVTTGTRWHQPEDKRVFMLGFDEYLRCRIYIQLPQTPTADTIDLPGNSFVHLLGRYDLPAESKIFLPVSGTFVVDSVTSKNLFGTIHGRYENTSGTPLDFDGQFKVKISD